MHRKKVTPRGRGGRWPGRAAFLFVLLGVPVLRAADWPMFGGRPDRNMVSTETGLPTEWDAGAKNPRKNIKWVGTLGKTTYAAPVVSGGRVFIGTDNDSPGARDRRGVLKCFSEADGRLLWQAVHEKLPDASEDDPSVGICSTPCVDGDRVYYVSNRAELICRAVEDGRELWVLDMRATLGASPNQASASSPLVANGMVFVHTGQGASHRSGVVDNPQAPSFVAVEARTGRVVWQDSSPGAKILTGQWSSPGYGVIDGQPQVAFPGGDGWLYVFEPATGRLLWKFNCKAHEKVDARGEPETTFNLVAAPVFAGDSVYIAVGEPEAGSGPGALRRIDARLRGDVTASAEIWRLGGEAFNDSLSSVAVHDGLVYAADTAGFVLCIDAATGRQIWSHDLMANIWGSPLVAEGKLYIQVGEGIVYIFATGREKKLLAKNETLLDGGHGTPVAANGVLYITGQNNLYAIAAEVRR
jgi:outer membrane protein assembly factor BamB